MNGLGYFCHVVNCTNTFEDANCWLTCKPFRITPMPRTMTERWNTPHSFAHTKGNWRERKHRVLPSSFSANSAQDRYRSHQRVFFVFCLLWKCPTWISNVSNGEQSAIYRYNHLWKQIIHSLPSREMCTWKFPVIVTYHNLSRFTDHIGRFKFTLK